MIIGIGCDHAAFTEKQLLIVYLKDNNHSVVDFGCNSNESVDYPDYAHALSKELIDEKVKVLSEASAPLAQKLYEEETKKQAAENQDGNSDDDSEVVDADFEEVKEEKEQQNS